MTTEKSQRTRVIVGGVLALLAVMIFTVRLSLRLQRGLGRIASRDHGSGSIWWSNRSNNAKAPPSPLSNEQGLAMALESLRKLAERSDAEPAHRTIFYLNQWLATDPGASKPWQPDRLLEALPRALRTTPGLERLTDLQFSVEGPAPWLDDIGYLQQNLWLHDIADRVRRDPPPAALKPWLKTIESSVGIPEAEQLAAAERMLDWVARNIQLDALPPLPQDPEATTGAERTVFPADRGQTGPGYSHLPLETLLYGHGDAHERARVFILLCRQAGIDAVMLGFQEAQSANRRGWCPAALVGGKLYLFDTMLGLPIPGPEGEGIASLDQIVKDPQLLRRLDVEGLPPYPVSEKELSQGVLAMIDAEPAALSRRMQLLEAAMPGSKRLALGVRPSELATALRKTNISNIYLWQVPLLAVRYRVGRMQRAAGGDQEVARDEGRQSFLFGPERPLVRARNLHMQARYENEGQKPAARSLYLQCRMPNREIDSLLTNELFRKSVGLDRGLPEDPTLRKTMLEAYVGIIREMKQGATYWLGLSYYDDNKQEPAIEWLTRTAEDSPASPWLPGARYNLARCYERLGQFDLARQWLQSDSDSPQRHGNLLRARQLAAEHQTAAGNKGTAK
jgi:tetratricopeptide (TPR) repeat protein